MKKKKIDNKTLLLGNLYKNISNFFKILPMIAHPYFESIKHHLLNTLDKADQKIYAAICWFTNEEIFKLLCKKLELGVSIELIILDDYINANPFGCNFSDFLNLGGHLYLSDVEHPVHNKYCLIDDKILINGSYNWTYYAETKNEENIIIFEDSSDLIKAFTSDFDRLKRIAKKVDFFKSRSILEFENINYENKQLSSINPITILSHDLFAKAILTNNKSYYEAAKRITPENISFQKQAIQLNWDTPITLKSTLAEEIKDDKRSIIFPKGTTIPCETTLTFHTIKDNQVEATMTIRSGEFDTASKNTKINSFNIQGIPKLKAGIGTIISEYKISNLGIMYIIIHIHDTGLIERRTIDLKKLEILENK